MTKLYLSIKHLHPVTSSIAKSSSWETNFSSASNYKREVDVTVLSFVC